MQSDSLPARERRDPLHLRFIERFPVSPPDRGFERDDRDGSRHSSARRAVDDLLQLFERESRPTGRQRHEGDRAQCLDAVTRVVIQVALGLNDRATRSAGQGSHREMIGQRAGRHEDRPLFSEERCELFLQRANRSPV